MSVKTNEFQILKLNLFELVITKKIYSILNVDTYLSYRVTIVLIWLVKSQNLFKIVFGF